MATFKSNKAFMPNLILCTSSAEWLNFSVIFSIGYYSLMLFLITRGELKLRGSPKSVTNLVKKVGRELAKTVVRGWLKMLAGFSQKVAQLFTKIFADS